MQKRVILIALSLFFLSVFIFSTTAQTPRQTTTDKGANFDKTCTGDSCNMIIYSYDKYFNRNGEWEEIDENWYSCGDSFCTKNYYFNVTADSSGLVRINARDRQFNQRISTFRNLDVNLSSPTISGSVLTYQNIIPNIDLKYQYLPHKLKEEIIIKQPIENLSRENFEIVFPVSGHEDFNLELPFICDSGRSCTPINYTISSSQISLIIPWRFLKSETTVYPLIIDPSFSLDNISIIWNGMVQYYDDGDVIGYSRISNPTSILIGASPYTENRGDIDWNLDNVPDTGNINNVTLKLFFELFESPNSINLIHMKKNSSEYPNDIFGNLDFFVDAADGSIYSNYNSATNTTNDFVNFTFNSDGLNEFKDAFSISKRFNFGIYAVPTKNITFSARDHPVASQRPSLIISYDFSAIEKGINNSLPNNPISSDQQIYVVDSSGQHALGRFDKTTTKNNQTWAFNYVVTGESFINMSSLLNIVNVWQNSSLSYAQIVSQVENFINSTKIP